MASRALFSPVGGKGIGMSDDDRLLDVRDVTVAYPGRHGRAGVRAVNGVSLHIAPGEVVGLVGESGCGKTSLGGAVMGILPLAGGDIFFQGEHLDRENRGWMRDYRRRVQMVFQDPMGALNPRLTAGDAIDETLFVNRHQPDLQTAGQRRARRRELLAQVGMDEASMAGRYPHELSGGQRQRIGIARALAVGPRLLVADEPVSALDVSVQVQILNLLKDISEQLAVACLFIAHDLAVVRYMCRRTYVMVDGAIVEEGLSDSLFDIPAHAYTAKLIAAVPDVARGLARRNGAYGHL
jgi:ABC-type glutathione transport system ATPase component